MRWGKLATMLRDKGKVVWVYDRKSMPPIEGVKHTDHWRECLRMSSVVFGCTGANWLELEHVPRLAAEPLRLISCSSRDVEFRNLLQFWSRHNAGRSIERFSPVDITWDNGSICRIVNWGFPINFDRVQEWESQAEIALTRGLVYIGVIQALATEVTTDQERIELLSIHAQQAVVSLWGPSGRGYPAPRTV